ncbi:MAG: Mrp/NBP35 family ATP-binding protein [Clostridia bacterium]|nr:Mrp/NBP35 family ATP-binding protein [Clostridia bacterium]
MPECSHNCETCSQNCQSGAEKTGIAKELPNDFCQVKKVIAVMSGKGGVGKSLVSAMLAVLSQRNGYKSAILDADITGPSIPRAFHLSSGAEVTESGIYPVASKTGIKIMSLNLLLEHESDPAVWRGPIIAGTVTQFWKDVVWGDVDCMYIDMPPGTGDVPLTVFQSLPVDAVIIVTSPQELVSMIVEKAVNMTKMMNVPILGIVENMSYYECPSCHEKHSIFGESGLEETAARFGIDTALKIPIDTRFAAACDKGMIELFENSALDKLADKIHQGL